MRLWVGAKRLGRDRVTLNDDTPAPDTSRATMQALTAQ